VARRAVAVRSVGESGHGILIACPPERKRLRVRHPFSASRRGPLAQLAEQQTLNLRVVGSIPTRLTSLRSRLLAKAVAP
jgi:hypothetical protein